MRKVIIDWSLNGKRDQYLTYAKDATVAETVNRFIVETGAYVNDVYVDDSRCFFEVSYEFDGLCYFTNLTVLRDVPTEKLLAYDFHPELDEQEFFAVDEEIRDRLWRYETERRTNAV